MKLEFRISVMILKMLKLLIWRTLSNNRDKQELIQDCSVLIAEIEKENE